MFFPGGSLKRKWYISFLSALGMEEAGIDGGGVFKEFFTMYGIQNHFSYKFHGITGFVYHLQVVTRSV
jgi:hypothetical protein